MMCKLLCCVLAQSIKFTKIFEKPADSFKNHVVQSQFKIVQKIQCTCIIICYHEDYDLLTVEMLNLNLRKSHNELSYCVATMLLKQQTTLLTCKQIKYVC